MVFVRVSDITNPPPVPCSVSDPSVKQQGAVYKGRPASGEGGGFEISDIPGRGEGWWFVKVRTSENF